MSRSKYKPHQNEKEKNRRKQQIADGRLKKENGYEDNGSNSD